MLFLFLVKRSGHSLGSFVTPQPIFHFLLTPELIHILAQEQVSLVVRIKLKEEQRFPELHHAQRTSARQLLLTTSVPRERTIHEDFCPIYVIRV